MVVYLSFLMLKLNQIQNQNKHNINKQHTVKSRCLFNFKNNHQMILGEFQIDANNLLIILID